MINYISEYRINKKGAECFRSRDFEQVKARFEELKAKKPTVYTMQRRDMRVNRYGVPETGSWGLWH